MIPFLLGSYTSIALASLWALARITGPRKPSHWLPIVIAAACWADNAGDMNQAQPATRLRGRAAVKQRDRRLQRTYGLCEDCRAEGRVRVADEVHHLVALKHGGPDTDENTMNLCVDHHKARTADQFGHKAPRRPIGKEGWPID